MTPSPPKQTTKSTRSCSLLRTTTMKVRTARERQRMLSIRLSMLHLATQRSFMQGCIRGSPQQYGKQCTVLSRISSDASDHERIKMHMVLHCFCTSLSWSAVVERHMQVKQGEQNHKSKERNHNSTPAYTPLVPLPHAPDTGGIASLLPILQHCGVDASIIDLVSWL